MSDGWNAVYVATEHGIVGYIEELPGTFAIAATIEEARRLLVEELRITLEANRRMTWECFKSAHVICRKPLSV